MKKHKPINKKSNNASSSFHKNLQDLQGAKFRILNKMLYTGISKDSLKYFNENQDDFTIYH